MRMRSQGSSACVRTVIAMCVLLVKSIARKPTRSITGAISAIIAVVSASALQRLWCPSRTVVSTRPIMRADAEEHVAVGHRGAVRAADLGDDAAGAGDDGAHQLHDLEDADLRALLDRTADLDERAARPGRARGRTSPPSAR